MTLPFPEAGVRLLSQSSLGMFASTIGTYRGGLQAAARELAAQYDQIKSEAQRLTAHLAERLTGLHDGQPKVFRGSAQENLRECIERFRRLNIRSSPELDALVEQAQQTITGIEPQTLRESNRLRKMVARDLEQIQARVGDLLVDRPRKNLHRRGGVGGAV